MILRIESDTTVNETDYFKGRTQNFTQQRRLSKNTLNAIAPPLAGDEVQDRRRDESLVEDNVHKEL